MAKKMGRPKKEINFEELKKLCQLQATLEEIAGWFEVSEDTILRRIKSKYKCTFAEYYKKASAGGKISLRREQYRVALTGNTAMLIWLGRQYLGQTDNRDKPEDTTFFEVNRKTVAQLIAENQTVTKDD